MFKAMVQQADILGRLRTVPPLPQVAQRVLALVRDPDYSVDELVNVVRTDPTLTARILRLCNSAMFSLRSEAHSVGDAVAFLGTRNLVKLVMASCAAPHFRRVPSSAYTSASELWRHSFAVGTSAQWLAKRAGHAHADWAFTVGILHDLGRLVLAEVAVTAPLPPPDAVDTTRLDRERRWLGIDHATAAGVVADAWGLPRELRQALRLHHEATPEAMQSTLGQVLLLAETLVLKAGIGDPFPDLELIVDADLVHSLHLLPEDLVAATAHCQEELKRHEELLNLGDDSSR